MGIVAVGSRSFIGLFSIERNEKIRMIDVDPNADALYANKGGHLSTNDVKQFAHSGSDQGVTPDMHSVYNGSKNIVSDRLSECNPDAPVATIKSISLSDFGQVVVYVEVVSPATALVALPSKHIILSYSLGGSMTGLFQVNSRVTCLNCHARGNVLSIGSEDGAVYFLDVSVLRVLYETRPHECCVRLSSSGEVLVPRSNDIGGIAAGGSAASAAGGGGAGGRGASGPHPTHRLHGTTTEGIGSALPASAIVKIRIGPKHDRPILAVISNATGHMFLIPFPDFIKYERAHPNSALAALVSAPIQAVRGTIAQAQNLSILAGDAAGTLAQSAKGLADDAIGEAQNFLKKMNKSKLFKGVGSFFGGGGGNK
jgi:hypothetical protein